MDPGSLHQRRHLNSRRRASGSRSGLSSTVHTLDARAPSPPLEARPPNPRKASSGDESKDEAAPYCDLISVLPEQTSNMASLSVALLYLPIANQCLLLCEDACVCVKEVCRSALAQVKGQA